MMKYNWPLLPQFMHKPHYGYDTINEGTIFAVWVKSRWTWDNKTNKPLAYSSHKEAHYALYKYKRRMRKICKSSNKLAERLIGATVCTYSSNTPTLSYANILSS